MKTREFTVLLDDLLQSTACPDYSDNGLQVEASKEIHKAAFAVDASLATFERAAALKADILVVHHGLFWGRSELLRGYPGERIRYLFEQGLSLYAVHLPLDAHPTLGNSAALIELAGARQNSWFAQERGLDLGCMGIFEPALSWKTLLANLKAGFGGPPLAVVGEPKQDFRVGSIGTVTGGGMKFAIEAAEKGADVYISGEPSHAWYHPVMETGIPCILYGHYATETLGIKKLQGYTAATWGLETVYIDHPTGM